MFPSIPTHIDAAYSPSVAEIPEGTDGVGTVTVPDTSLNVSPEGGLISAAPLQFLLYDIAVLFPVFELNFVFELVDSFSIIAEPWRIRELPDRLCMRWDRLALGAARELVAKTTEVKRHDENFMMK